MIFNIDFNVFSLDDNLQISVTKNAKTGQKVMRESRDEHPHSADGPLAIEKHPDYPYLIKSTNSYFLIEGSVRIRYVWEDGDVFTKDNVNEALAYKSKISPHFDKAKITVTDNELKIDYTYESEENADWMMAPIHWEPDTLKASIEIREDDTIILCPMQYAPGWTFEEADIKVGSNIDCAKQGTICYVFFGQECKIGDKVMPRHSIKKLTSDTVNIVNDSSKACRLVRIWK